jgi:hypothetical protein
MMSQKTMLETAKNKKFGVIRKLQNSYDEYDLMFGYLRSKPIRILEIGVQGGGLNSHVA